MTNYAYGANESEKMQLTHFINRLQRFLSGLIGADTASRMLFGSLADDLINAWNEMPSHFDELRVKLALKDDLALTIQGLTGGQLGLKMALIERSMNQFNEARAKNGFDKETINRLKQLLMAFDILIYDLIQATSSGCAVSSFHKSLISILDGDGET